MDLVVAQLALIFTPGILWAVIDAKYGNGPKPDQTEFLIRAFLFGVTTYTVLFVIYTNCGKPFGYDSLPQHTPQIDLISFSDEIAFSIPVSFALSIFWLYGVNNKLFTCFLHKIRASKRFAETDVWSFAFNSKDAYAEYINFRDIENGYIFSGWVSAFSDNEEYRELLLRDAIIRCEDGTVISETPTVYISRRKESIWIEFPYEEET